MISVVIATHNEEKNLARCLESVKSFADEIVIVDGDSTDQTVAIAESFGARVIHTTNKSNFHINKQMAMDEARGDLVLQLDADEVVDQELMKFICSINLSETKASAWWLRRRNFFLSRFLTKGGQYPDPVIRLYKNGYARLPQKNVHEQMSVEGSVETAPGHILHYPYPDLQMYMKKFATYTSFEAARIADSTEMSSSQAVQFLLFKPISTFFLLYLRHKGFVDGVPGLLFALMSSLHHPFVYLQLWERKQKT